MSSSREQWQDCMACRSNKISPRQGGEIKTSKKFPIDLALLVLNGLFFAVLSFYLCPSFLSQQHSHLIWALITLFSYVHSLGEEALTKKVHNEKFSKNDRIAKIDKWEIMLWWWRWGSRQIKLMDLQFVSCPDNCSHLKIKLNKVIQSFWMEIGC